MECFVTLRILGCCGLTYRYNWPCFHQRKTQTVPFALHTFCSSISLWKINFLESKGNKTITITAIWRQHDVPVDRTALWFGYLQQHNHRPQVSPCFVQTVAQKVSRFFWKSSYLIKIWNFVSCLWWNKSIYH